MIRPADRDVKLFNDEFFSQLRETATVPDDFINAGWSLETLESGGAKGGCLMAFVGSTYVVKELSTDDHAALLEISESYFEHVRSADTLLSAIFLHFEDLATGRKFFAMQNAVGHGPFLAMYDLKGCNDDKTLELFGSKIRAASRMLAYAGQYCGYFGSSNWYKACAEFSAGKRAAARADLVVTTAQREDVIRRIKRDTDWLVKQNIMDYSMIVGVKTGPPGFTFEGSLGYCPLTHTCADGSEVAVCVGIIDFLQKWNLKKKTARAIKCLECNKATVPPARYARRFYEYFEDRFVCTKETDKQAVVAKLTGKEMPTEDDQFWQSLEAIAIGKSSESCKSVPDEPCLVSTKKSRQGATRPPSLMSAAMSKSIEMPCGHKHSSHASPEPEEEPLNEVMSADDNDSNMKIASEFAYEEGALLQCDESIRTCMSQSVCARIK
jgi:hypothetical protein